MGQETTVRAVDRALAILDCFSDREHEISLMEISRLTGLSAATASRILSTLAQRDYVFRDEKSGLYSLGWKLVHLGNHVISNAELCSVSYPILKELHSVKNESYSIYVPRGFYRVCIARYESSQSVRQNVEIGSIRPLDVGSSGHILMAYTDSDAVRELRETSHICLPGFLEQVRKQGYSTSNGEYFKDSRSVSGPIFNHQGEVIAALCVSGPVSRFDNHAVEECIRIIKDYSQRISLQLGYGIHSD